MTATNHGSTIAVWALIVALIALGFSVVAFNRGGKNIKSIVREETVSTTRTAEQIVARARTEARLASLKTELAAERGYEEAVQEVSEIRADLQQAYRNASTQARQEWRQLDTDLGQLEQNVRDKSADSLLTLEGLLALLRQDIRHDDN